MQPQYAGPWDYQANLSIPVNSTLGGSQAGLPLAPVSFPPRLQLPPDIFVARNNLTAANSACLVCPANSSLLELSYASAILHSLIDIKMNQPFSRGHFRPSMRQHSAMLSPAESIKAAALQPTLLSAVRVRHQVHLPLHPFCFRRWWSSLI